MALARLRSDWRRLLSAASAWAYVAEDGRDLRIDLLRGLAVLAMVIDHLAGPSKLYLITGGNRFYTSAAEGFIFLSGLTVGLVYRRVAERDGLSTAMRRLLARSWTLYVLAVGLTLVMLPLSESLQLPWAVGIDQGTPLQTVWSILSLHQTYYLVDVLALYVLLMLAAPLVLLLLCEGRTVLVLGAAWLIWAGFQFFPRQTELPWTTAGNNLFYLAAWQALFFTAMVLGFHRKRLGALFPKQWRLPLLLATGLGLAGLIVVYSNQSAALQALQSVLASVPGMPAWSIADLEDGLFAKGDVRPGRVIASAVVFGFLFLFVTVFWAPVRRSLAWLLLTLGQNALYAYSTHVVLALILGLFSTHLVLGENTSLSAAIQVASIGLIWLAIRWRVLYPSPENRRLWMGSVVPLALVATVVLRPSVPSAGGVAELAASGVVAAADLDATAETASAPNFQTQMSPSSAQSQTSDDLRRARAFGTPVPRLSGATPPGTQAAAGAAPGSLTTSPGSLTTSPGASQASLGSSQASLGASQASLGSSQASPGAPDASSGASQASPGMSQASLDALSASPLQTIAADDPVSGITPGLAGSLREVTFYSPALDRDMAYYVYLPPGYATEGRRYPVLYMLHGAGGSKDEWPAYGLVSDVDRSIASKDINPMIVVLPQGDQGYWVDWANDGPHWGDYIARDLRHQVDATFRTLPDAAHRAIGGLSMGGAGALQLAFTHPNTFAVVGAHSPSLHVDDGTFSGIYGTGLDFAEREPLDLAVSAPDIESLKIWIDVGEADPWLERDEVLHTALLDRGIAHNYSVLPGGHDGDYWTQNLPAYLHFYDSLLSGNA